MSQPSPDQTPNNVTPIRGWQAPEDLKTEYDPDNLYVRATNAYNHHAKVTVAIPPELAAVVDDIVANQPYKGVKDFVRDAIYHRVHYWNTHGKTNEIAARWMQVERAACYVESIRAENEAMRELLVGLKDQMEDLKAMRDYETLAALVNETEDLIERVRGPWREKLAVLVNTYR